MSAARFSQNIEDPVDVYIFQTELLRQIAAEEEPDEKLVFAYDARRYAAVNLLQSSEDAMFRLAERRPDLVKQAQADIEAQEVINRLQLPLPSASEGSSSEFILAQANESLQSLRAAVQSPESAEMAAQARALLERVMERALPNAGLLYTMSKQSPPTARGVLATAYEPAEMNGLAMKEAILQGERWRKADAKVEEAANAQNADMLAKARRERDIETFSLARNGLAIYSLAVSDRPLSLRAELALDAESHDALGRPLGDDEVIDRNMKQALGEQIHDIAARYVWLAEEAMAADAGKRYVWLAPRLRARAKMEARAIEKARLDPSSEDRLAIVRLASLAKNGRPWLARSFAHDRKPAAPRPEPGTIGITPDMNEYVEKQQAAPPREGGSSKEDPLFELAAQHPERFVEVEGYRVFSAKRLEWSEGSAAGLVALVMPQQDAHMRFMLRSNNLPAFALPFSKFAGSGTVERELTALYKRDPKRFWSLFQGTHNLSMAIMKHPGGIRALSENDRQSLDHLQLGLRAMAIVALKQNPKEYEARVENVLQPLFSEHGLALLERSKKDPAYRAALRDPDCLIQGGQRDQFAERLAQRGSLRPLQGAIKKIASDMNQIVGLGLVKRLSDAFIDESVR